MPVIRGLVVPVASPLPAGLLGLMADFRLLTNATVRHLLETHSTSKGAGSKFARNWALANRLTGQHAIVAAEIAISLARGHRHRVHRGLPSKIPYIRERFLRTRPQAFHLDLDSGKIRVSLRNGEWCSFFVHLAPYHRGRLQEPGVRLKQVQVSPDRAILFIERLAPEPYSPTSLVALDTNERSMDGVSVTSNETQPVQIDHSEIPRIQAVHFVRRRRLARKKAHDRRVGRRLLRKEGVRERHRVRSRLHVLTSHLIRVLVQHRASLALEDLTRLPQVRRRGRRNDGRRTSPRFRRRLSSWPRRELHRQLEYKAQDHGVPVYWINPYRTSVTCPRCGEVRVLRSRAGPTFTCDHCGWALDRQLNAGVNVGRTALREIAELGGLRLDLDDLSRDARRPRYPFEASDGHGRNGGRGRDGSRNPAKRWGL